MPKPSKLLPYDNDFVGASLLRIKSHNALETMTYAVSGDTENKPDGFVEGWRFVG